MLNLRAPLFYHQGTFPRAFSQKQSRQIRFCNSDTNKSLFDCKKNVLKKSFDQKILGENILHLLVERVIK